MRRLAVDTLARAGVDVATAAQLIGHSEEVMLELYRQVNTDDRVSAVRRAGMGSRPRANVVPMRRPSKRA